MYEANHGAGGQPAWDVVAATDDAATIGVVAAGASVWSVRSGATATRLFFARPSGGIWMSAVPQTPGR